MTFTTAIGSLGRMGWASVVLWSACARPAASTTLRPETERRAAVDACLDGYRAARSSAEPWLAIASACAPIYSRTRCRDAFVGAGGFRAEERLTVIASRCADDYCRSLGEKASPLCARRSEPTVPAELALAWAQLNAAILVHELGREEAERLASEARVAASASSPGGPAAAEEKPVVVRVWRDRRDLVVSVAPDEGRAPLGPFRVAPGETEYAAVVGAARPFRGRRAIVRVASDVIYFDVLMLMEALRDAGLVDVAFTQGLPEATP